GGDAIDVVKRGFVPQVGVISQLAGPGCRGNAEHVFVMGWIAGILSSGWKGEGVVPDGGDDDDTLLVEGGDDFAKTSVDRSGHLAHIQPALAQSRVMGVTPGEPAREKALAHRNIGAQAEIDHELAIWPNLEIGRKH